MNERIKELVGKAWKEADKEVSEEDWHTWVHNEIFQEKFALLIIKECIRIDIENPDARPGVEIARHFRVES